MPKQLTLGSLFDGSGGFPLAGLLNGVRPVWASEIEPFPIRVTTKRLPWMKHYGDISTINGAEVEPVDILTFGSPCQDLSVAGKRAGLQDGERSNLFYQAIRIAKEMRKATNGEYPKYLVWENVAGAFSSNHGEDFRCVLQAFCSICDDPVSVPEPVGGKWRKAGAIVGSDRSYAVGWRTLNAMHWGVPQRRERVFAVVSLADQSAANLLFERESVSGHSAESRRPWERFTRPAEAGSGTTGFSRRPLILDDQGGQQMTVRDDDKFGTLRAEAHQHLPIIVETHPQQAAGFAWRKSAQSDIEYRQEVGPTLVADRNDASCIYPTPSWSAGFCTEHSAKARSIGYEEEAPTLRTGVVPATIYAVENHPAGSRVDIRDDGTCQTLTSRMGTGGGNVPLVMQRERERERADDLCGCTVRSQNVLDAGNISDADGLRVQGSNQRPRQIPYGIGGYNSEGMLSDNPHSGIYEADVARTLDLNGGSPACNQGGIAIVESGGFDCRNMAFNPELSATLQAKSGGGTSLNYINPVAVAAKEE